MGKLMSGGRAEGVCVCVVVGEGRAIPNRPPPLRLIIIIINEVPLEGPSILSA